MRVSEAESAESGVVGSMREGVLEQKFLLTGVDGSPNNYLINVGRTGAGGWQAPRHRHNFDQIRYVIKGNYPYGTGKSMPEGWVGYFPESVPYGPQDRPEGLEMVVCQFGGSAGNGFLSVADREAANDALKEIGEFKNGIFSYVGEDGKRHTQDGSEACFEKAMGRKLTYAKPRYEDLVMMNPANFDWIPTGEKGVYAKHLGSFTERNTRIGFLKLDEGATWSGGLEDSIQILYLATGHVRFEGREYGPRSAFEFQAHEGPVPITATAPTEFFSIVLPKF